MNNCYMPLRPSAVIQAAESLAYESELECLEAISDYLAEAGVLCQATVDLYDLPGYFFISATFSKVVVSSSLSAREKIHLYGHFIAHLLLGHLRPRTGVYFEYLEDWAPRGKLDSRRRKEEEAAQSFVDAVEAGEATAWEVLQALSRSSPERLTSVAHVGLARHFIECYHGSKVMFGYRVAARRGQNEGYMVSRRARQDEVFVLENGTLRRIVDLRSLSNRGKKRCDVRFISDWHFKRLPRGRPIRFGQLLRLSGAEEIYLVHNGVRRHIQSMAVFERLGFSHWDVRDVAREYLESVPAGSPVDEQAAEEIEENDALYRLSA